MNFFLFRKALYIKQIISIMQFFLFTIVYNIVIKKKFCTYYFFKQKNFVQKIKICPCQSVANFFKICNGSSAKITNFCNNLLNYCKNFQFLHWKDSTKFFSEKNSINLEKIKKGVLFRVQRSLVARMFWEHEVVGSNPATLKKQKEKSPFRLEVQDIAFSRRKHGFDSRKGYKKKRRKCWFPFSFSFYCLDNLVLSIQNFLIL